MLGADVGLPAGRIQRSRWGREGAGLVVAPRRELNSLVFLGPRRRSRGHSGTGSRRRRRGAVPGSVAGVQLVSRSGNYKTALYVTGGPAGRARDKAQW